MITNVVPASYAWSDPPVIRSKITNIVHHTARIGPGVRLGEYNTIGERVVIEGDVVVGDCNRIENDTRILAGEGGQVRIGDWGVFHNHCFIGPGNVVIGHNAWLGEMTVLDGRGGLHLGHGVRIGTMGHVWTHAAAAEQFEGGLYHIAPTVLEDDVWLVGDNVTVNPGVEMAKRSVALPHSVVTKPTLPGKTYAGAPAREVDIPFWGETTHEQRWNMMCYWVEEFCKTAIAPDVFRVTGDPGSERIEIRRSLERLVIGFGVMQRVQPDEYTTLFDLTTKRYTKHLTQLEREFYRFVYGNRVRFIPETP